MRLAGACLAVLRRHWRLPLTEDEARELATPCLTLRQLRLEAPAAEGRAAIVPHPVLVYLVRICSILSHYHCNENPRRGTEEMPVRTMKTPLPCLSQAPADGFGVVLLLDVTKPAGFRTRTLRAQLLCGDEVWLARVRLHLWLRTTVHSLHTRLARILGTSVSEATMRPNPRSGQRWAQRSAGPCGHSSLSCGTRCCRSTSRSTSACARPPSSCRGARLALDVKVIKCPSPRNVLKDTYDHIC